MAKKMRKFEKGGDVDPLEEANQRFEAEEAAEPKTRSIAAPKEAEPEAKPEPKPKPTLKMGTAKEFAESGLTRTEYMNKINNLKSRVPAVAKEEAPAKKSSDELKTMGARMREKTAKDNYAKTGPTDINSMMKARLQPKTFKYASGGSVTRGDGCAQRGKTRGMMR
jgi:hypothetical protein